MAQELQIMSGHTPFTAVAEDKEFVTMRVAEQLFGISVMAVQDVLRGLKVTRVPLAPKQITGSLNLRGRVVTAINLRECLELPAAPEGEKSKIMSVVVEYKGEFFSLIVDSVGEVINLSASQMERSPANLSSRWKEVSAGVYKLQDELLIILDVHKLLRF